MQASRLPLQLDYFGAEEATILDTNLKLVRFPARSPLPIAALPSMSLIPSARFTNPHELNRTLL
jgi:hypothetical protein